MPPPPEGRTPFSLQSKPISTDYYPPVGFHFKVEFDLDNVKQKDAYFQEVSGLSVELETKEVTDGGQNEYKQILPTRASYSPITLKRGMLLDSGLIAWVKEALQNLKIRPITVLVSLLNENHEPLVTFSVEDAWPKKWSISDFNAEDGKLVIETLELVYRRFKIY